jgi:hypothetical protein
MGHVTSLLDGGLLKRGFDKCCMRMQKKEVYNALKFDCAAFPRVTPSGPANASLME